MQLVGAPEALYFSLRLDREVPLVSPNLGQRFVWDGFEHEFYLTMFPIPNGPSRRGVSLKLRGDK